MACDLTPPPRHRWGGGLERAQVSAGDISGAALLAAAATIVCPRSSGQPGHSEYTSSEMSLWRCGGVKLPKLGAKQGTARDHVLGTPECVSLAGSMDAASAHAIAQRTSSPPPTVTL